MRILRILRSQALPCRCFVGVYETYAGQTVRIIEEPGPGCRESLHKPGRVVSDRHVDPTLRPASRPRTPGQ
jgi:hypothetical protein